MWAEAASAVPLGFASLDIEGRYIDHLTSSLPALRSWCLRNSVVVLGFIGGIAQRFPGDFATYLSYLAIPTVWALMLRAERPNATLMVMAVLLPLNLHLLAIAAGAVPWSPVMHHMMQGWPTGPGGE